MARAAAEKAAPPKTKIDADPIGCSLFSDEVAVGDQAVPSSTIVGAGLEMSGLSVEEWNALGESEIDKRLKGVLDAMNAAWRAARGASGAVVFDPLNPGSATLRMAQAITVHHQEIDEATGKPHGPHIPFSLKAGINHDVPAWVAEHEFVRENLDKS